jgi:hypothetical protein
MDRMNWKNALIRGGLILLSLMFFMVVALTVAGTAMKHPVETAAFNEWIQASRFEWLTWRLALYAALGWGIWKIHRAPGFRDEYRQPLRRMTSVSVVFILLCEYALLGQTGV